MKPCLSDRLRPALFLLCGWLTLGRSNAQLSTSHRLAFADEFNGTAVDTSKWAVASPSWTMPNSNSAAAANQVSVADGVLTLNATRTATSGTTQFSSGSISSYGIYNFDGGYVEASIDLPGTPGSWPAFWGLYTGWPPEADIMEYPLTTDGGTNGYVNDTYHTAFHYTNASGSAAAGAGPIDTNVNLNTSGYHIFAMDWASDTSMKFFMDGAQRSTFTSGTDVAEMANMYMILDYAVGGWPGTPTTTQWPLGASDQTKVDWVRVWQLDATPDATSNWNLDGGGSFDTSGNWSNGNVPRYGNRTAVFGRVGTAATATITLPAWKIFGNLTFNGGSGTTAYTIGSPVSLIQLAGQPLGASPVGASVQASSSSTVSQTIGARVQLWSATTARNDMTGGQTLNFNGQLSGAGALNVTGAGTTQLNTTNLHSGGTNIGTAQEAAVLRANANNSLGSGAVVIGPSGNATTARLELSGGFTQAAAIDLRGRNNNSVGIQSVAGNNTLVSGITANSGGSICQIQSDAGTLSLAGTLSAGSGTRTFTLQGAGTGVVSGAVQNGAGTVGLTKDGSGTWSLTGPVTCTGTTTVTNGTLRLTTGPTAVASYTFDNVSGTTIVNGGSGGATMNGTLTSGATVVSGGRSGNAVSLSGGSYVNINSPIVDLGNTGNWTISAWVKTTTAGATILSKANSNSWSTGNSIFYLGDGKAAGSGGIPSSVRYAGGFFQGAANATSVNDNTWHMVTYVNSGGVFAIYVDGVAQGLSIGNSGFGNADVGTTVRLGFTTNTVASDGTVHFNGLLDEVQLYNQALSPAQIAMVYQGQVPAGSLPATASVTIANGATFDVSGVSQTIASLAGGGNLTKSGPGTLTLSGTNSYNGATTLSAGTLAVNGSIATGGSVSTASGTILKGIGSISATTTINGTHQPGMGVGTQSFGTLTYGGTGRLSWELTANSISSGFDKVAATGVISFTTGAAIDLLFNSAGSATDFTHVFWTQPRSWPVLTGSALSGSLALGTISVDSLGHAVSTVGSFSLQQTSTTVNLTFTPWTPRDLWRQANFGVDWTVESIAGDQADPDKDGVKNLLERAFGGNPNTAESNLLPVSALPLLSIEYRKATSATDLTFGIQQSTTLTGTWTSASGTSVLLGEQNGVQRYRFTTDTSATRKFLRVQVTGP